MAPIALPDKKHFMGQVRIIIGQQEVLVKSAVMFEYEVNPFIYNEDMGNVRVFREFDLQVQGHSAIKVKQESLV
jgi:hypothetical protein